MLLFIFLFANILWFCFGFHWSRCFCFWSRRRFWLAWREINFMNCSCGAFFNTLAAKLTLFKINISKVVFKRDGIKGAGFNAFAATDTCHRTVFLCRRAFFLVHAAHKNPAVFFAFVAQLDDIARTSSNTSATGHTFIFHNFGQPGFFVHENGIEGTCSNTIT